MMGELESGSCCSRRKRSIVGPSRRRDTIPLNYLEALEGESLDAFGRSDLHARGFLRNYALYLGLDTNEILELCDQMQPGQSRRNPRVRQAAYARSQRQVTSAGRRWPWMPCWPWC